MTHTNRQTALAERTLCITCIVPVHNEAEHLAAFLHALQTKLSTLTNRYEILCIDDGSTDTSANIIAQQTDSHIKLIRFSRNFGKEQAISAGIDHASGDVAIIIDADFQHPLETIDAFVQAWVDGYDMVYGIRDNRENESWLKRNFSRLFYWLMQQLCNTPIVPDAGDFRLMDRQVVASLQQCKERNRFMKGLYGWVGFNNIGISYQVQERKSGHSSWSFKNLLSLAIAGITAFSDTPLRIWSVIGLIIFLFSILCGTYIIIDTLLFGIDVPGYATLLTVVIFFGSLQMLSVGILGEYIARVYREVKQRPPYIIDHRIDKDNATDPQ